MKKIIVCTCKINFAPELYDEGELPEIEKCVLCCSSPLLFDALKRIVEAEEHQCHPDSTYCQTNCMWDNAKKIIDLVED